MRGVVWVVWMVAGCQLQPEGKAHTGATNQSTASGARVLQWDDNGTPDHLWTLAAR